MFESFDEIARDIASRLQEGASDRRSAMHTPVVVTADADARVMVLRSFDQSTRTMRFHTDIRSPKCELIGSGAPVGVLGYDREARIQLRCRGVGRIEGDTAVADAAWAESTEFARRCYLGDGPGTRVSGPSSGLPDWIEGKKPTEEEVAPAREHFAVLLVELSEVDWFFLSHDGHRRAVIDMASGEWRWITP